MARNFDNADWLIDLNMGNIQGHSDAYKFGNNADIDAIADEDLWPDGGLMNWPTAAQKITVVSSDATDDAGNTGAHKILVQGLDASYAIITEEVTLDGTTPVDTAASFLRAFRCEITEVGSNEINKGTIDLKWKVDANDCMSITAAHGQSTHCGFTLPANHKAWITSLDCFIENAATSSAEVRVWTRKYNESSNNNYDSWKCQYITTLSTVGNSISNKEFKAMLELSEKMDIRVAAGVTADDTDVGCRLEYFLMDLAFFN